jgi:2-oxo-4-hydroxy-4-carboxy-5-ureidoimidazoline decarboxylase
MGVDGSPEPIDLDSLNALPAGLARRRLLACCSAARWAEELVSGRPYSSADEILARSDDATASLAPADLEQALAGHPRIGAGAAADERSRREQAGVLGADPATMTALAGGNEAYERRFGHIYLVCATGRSAPELLALLRERLGNDPGTERGVVRRELGKINRIRLRRLLGHDE